MPFFLLGMNIRIILILHVWSSARICCSETLYLLLYFFLLQACHLDPILDDSVMFAKRLRRLGKNVDLHVIEDLPHGFLNFSLVSKDAKQASDVCISKIQKMLKMGMKIRL